MLRTGSNESKIDWSYYNVNDKVNINSLIEIYRGRNIENIVDDSTKSPGKKRQAVLNPNYKYIGISSKFIGKTFVAYFTSESFFVVK